MKLLLIEDNEVQKSVILAQLGEEDVDVVAVTTGAGFRSKLATDSYDVIIVDLVLPDIDGLQLIRERRAAKDRTPILVISGKSGLDDRLRCFEAGADDYLVKPFSNLELLARARAVARRASGCRDEAIVAGNLAIDGTARFVTCSSVPLKVTPTERSLLLLLASRRGTPVDRSEIAELLPRSARASAANSVEKLVSRLRHSLADSESGVRIVTVRGVGYRLELVK
jgi:two-component system response regulator TctD